MVGNDGRRKSGSCRERRGARRGEGVGCAWDRVGWWEMMGEGRERETGIGVGRTRDRSGMARRMERKAGRLVKSVRRVKCRVFHLTNGKLTG